MYKRQYGYYCRRKQKRNGRLCGKAPVRLINGTWVTKTHESYVVVLFGFRWFVRGGGARQQQQYWHLIPPWTREGRRWQERMTRSPVRLCSRDGKICYYRRLEYDFLFSCLPFFFPSFAPSSFGCVSLSPYNFVRAAVICSTSASSCVLLVSFVFCLLSAFLLVIKYLFYIFRMLLFLVGVFIVLSYPGTLAFDLPN